MKSLGILLIRAYQTTVGPLFSGSCRFEPSCSNYGIQALERFGLLRGSWLTLRRLLRCRPFGPHGYDPVPETWPGLFGKRSMHSAECTMHNAERRAANRATILTP